MSVYESAEWRAMVAAVVAAPDDDLPRLVAADFLEERGEADRAELVRVQVELARMEESGELCEIDPHEGHTCCEDPCPVCSSVEKYAGLHKRVQDLIQGPPGTDLVNARGVLSALPGYKLVGWNRPLRPAYQQASGRDLSVLTCEFRRGFVESVSCPAAAWLAHGDDVLKHHPVRRVRLTTYPVEGNWEGLDLIDAPPLHRFAHGRWPGVEFELPGDPYGGYLIPPGPGRDDLIARLGGPSAGSAGHVTVNGRRVRVVGWNDPRVAAADMAPDPADD